MDRGRKNMKTVKRCGKKEKEHAITSESKP
jgi:hypothetical protein